MQIIYKKDNKVRQQLEVPVNVSVTPPAVGSKVLIGTQKYTVESIVHIGADIIVRLT